MGAFLNCTFFGFQNDYIITDHTESVQGARPRFFLEELLAVFRIRVFFPDPDQTFFLLRIRISQKPDP